MLRRLIQIFILVPLAAFLIAFSLANRHLVTVSFDPVGGDEPALSLPLFVLFFFVLLVGILLGGLAAWLRQSKWRRKAKLEHREAERWRSRAEEEARRAARQEVVALPPRQRTADL